MDRFPSFPPAHDDAQDPTEGDLLLFWVAMALGVVVWASACVGLGYWLAGRAPDIGVYVHGLLLGMLLGIALVASLIRPHARRHPRTPR